jgi:hypothetical protein
MLRIMECSSTLGVVRYSLLAIVWAAAIGVSVAEQPKELDIVSTVDLGAVSKPATVVGRDGGESALVGGKMLWTFGDTIYSPQAEDGSNLRSNTAALADPRRPLEVSEPVDLKGAPRQAVPFTEVEQKYNAKSNRPDDRIALWIGGVASVDPDHGLSFFSVLHVGEGLYNYTHRGIGTAVFEAGSTEARRNEGLLFTADEPGFARTLVYEGMLYLYGALPREKGQGFGVARAPLAKATERSAYEFWNGAEWTSDVEQTAVVFDQIPGGVSISYNAHLGKFLAIHSGMMVSDVRGRTAPRPEGPWNDATILFAVEEGKGGWCYAAQEHPELAQDGGRNIFISYHRPLPQLMHGEVRLVEATLK